jgi:TatD DNase family protein
LLAESDDRVWWAAGFHPYVADRHTPDTPRKIKEALRHPRAVALGEIGLDYYKHCSVPRPRQLEVFEALARAGAEADKPLILHCREADLSSTDAQEDMLKLERVFHLPSPVSHLPAVRGVAHCFQGTIDNALRFISLGFMIGVDAPLTYPKAQSLRDMAAALPLESLVLETDSPYLPPQDRRGKRNEPSYLPSVAAALGLAKKVPVDQIVRATTENAERLYRKRVKSHD